MIAPITAMTTMTSNAMSRNWPNAAPSPRELASQAKPKPAARPPSMAPQGRLGATAAGGVAGAAGLAAPCDGAAWRCVTLPDCLPIDRPPPRRAASALTLANSKNTVNIKVQNFIISPENSLPNAGSFQNHKGQH